HRDDSRRLRHALAVEIVQRRLPAPERPAGSRLAHAQDRREAAVCVMVIPGPREARSPESITTKRPLWHRSSIIDPTVVMDSGLGADLRSAPPGMTREKRTMPTDCLFREDAYLTSTPATVVGISEKRGLIVDRTCFYATSGGQPGDSGMLVTA